MAYETAKGKTCMAQASIMGRLDVMALLQELGAPVSADPPPRERACVLPLGTRFFRKRIPSSNALPQAVMRHLSPYCVTTISAEYFQPLMSTSNP